MNRTLRWMPAALGVALLLPAGPRALARLRWRSRCRCVTTADARFAVLEHQYVTYLLRQFPVVATYLGGSAFDPTLAARGRHAA